MPKLRKDHLRKKIRSQVNLLNDIVKVRLEPSSIHGVGVFAMRDIKKGEQLYTGISMQGFDVPYKKFYMLRKDVVKLLLEQFPLIKTGSGFIYPVTIFQAFMNHSKNASNCDAKKDIATRDIKKGEEITENYKLITKAVDIYPFLKSV